MENEFLSEILEGLAELDSDEYTPKNVNCKINIKGECNEISKFSICTTK